MTLCALTSCRVVISKQLDDSASGWPVEQVCNRKETTWYENHVVIFRQSVQPESRVEPEIRSRSEALLSFLAIRLARGCKRWHPLDPGRKYGARSPFSEYMSLHLSLKITTIVCPPFREWNERYISLSSSSSSSSCRAASTDILDHLSPLLPIIHRLRQVFWVTSCVLT